MLSGGYETHPFDDSFFIGKMSVLSTGDLTDADRQRIWLCSQRCPLHVSGAHKPRFAARASASAARKMAW